MPNFIPNFNQRFNDSYEAYCNAKANYANLNPQNIPTTYTHLDLRIRLSLFSNPILPPDHFAGADFSISLNRLIKNAEMWFAYESLIRFGRELGVLQNNRELLPRAFTQQMINIDLLLNDFLTEVNDYLFNQIIQIPRRRNGFINFLDTAIAAPGVGQQLNAGLVLARNRINNNQHLSHQDFCSIIYYLRNKYVHEGNVSIYDFLSYTLSRSFFELMYDFLCILTLTVSTHIFNELYE